MNEDIKIIMKGLNVPLHLKDIAFEMYGDKFPVPKKDMKKLLAGLDKNNPLFLHLLTQIYQADYFSNKQNKNHRSTQELLKEIHLNTVILLESKKSLEKQSGLLVSKMNAILLASQKNSKLLYLFFGLGVLINIEILVVMLSISH
ncbi:hypothetical protein [Hydrogenovibrio kuenenii]|uniref:hypothetical protein n=1 Tax=Hydrogenovibrio kuenenii TaxID=63658 RepID=UPI00046318E8|nr:hypothetical protein [Hydrogenovibrio kuenenii]